MSATKKKSGKPRQNGSLVESVPPGSVMASEVLTLSEAAKFLRIAESEVIRLAVHHDLPGRLIGQEWRFLKCALENWLGTPLPLPSKEAALSRIGSWENDPYIEQELEEIHRRRGRPISSDSQ